MNLAVKFPTTINNDPPILDIWPIEAKVLGESTILPEGEGWVLMTEDEYFNYKSLHQEDFDTWYESQRLLDEQERAEKLAIINAQINSTKINNVIPPSSGQLLRFDGVNWSNFVLHKANIRWSENINPTIMIQNEPIEFAKPNTTFYAPINTGQFVLSETGTSFTYTGEMKIFYLAITCNIVEPTENSDVFIFQWKLNNVLVGDPNKITMVGPNYWQIVSGVGLTPLVNGDVMSPTITNTTSNDSIIIENFNMVIQELL